LRLRVEPSPDKLYLERVGGRVHGAGGVAGGVHSRVVVLGGKNTAREEWDTENRPRFE
jgi:hypothetical protein